MRPIKPRNFKTRLTEEKISLPFARSTHASCSDTSVKAGLLTFCGSESGKRVAGNLVELDFSGDEIDARKDTLRRVPRENPFACTRKNKVTPDGTEIVLRPYDPIPSLHEFVNLVQADNLLGIKPGR